MDEQNSYTRNGNPRQIQLLINRDFITFWIKLEREIKNIIFLFKKIYLKMRVMHNLHAEFFTPVVPTKSAVSGSEFRTKTQLSSSEGCM